jgi:hypothetical protein
VNDRWIESISGAQAEWKIRLECGHEIRVPWSLASPAVAACMIEHRERCESPPPELGAVPWWASPLARSPPLPVFRSV